MANDDKGAKLDRDGIEELRYIQQIYQNQYAMTGNSINALLRELQELSSAQKTLESMDLVQGKETLTGIGGDFYLVGKIENPKKALVGIGAGYVVEKDIDSAKLHVAELIKKHTENLNNVTKSRKQIENALIEISYRLENSR